MARQPVVVGIDLGGLNVRLALVSRTGEILARWERATATMADADSLIQTLAADLTACGDEARTRGLDLKAVGLGVCGRILALEGKVVYSAHVPALTGCALLPRLQELTPWPLFLENDGNLFILGEGWLGAGVDHPQVLGITLGMGIGGGLILNGRLWPGTYGTAAEIGHITVDPEGRRCTCGNRGCLETVASGSWAVAWAKEQLAQGAASWLEELYQQDPDSLQGEALVVAAQQGDPLALKAFERVGKGLGLAIATTVHLLGLSRVIIGGRFAGAWEVFKFPMLEEVHRRLTLFPPELVDISPAKLGDDAGVLGAARLAWEGSQ